MCRGGPGGRRCPSHSTQSYRDRWNAQRRANYAARRAAPADSTPVSAAASVPVPAGPAADLAPLRRAGDLDSIELRTRLSGPFDPDRFVPPRNATAEESLPSKPHGGLWLAETYTGADGQVRSAWDLLNDWDTDDIDVVWGDAAEPADNSDQAYRDYLAGLDAFDDDNGPARTAAATGAAPNTAAARGVDYSAELAPDARVVRITCWQDYRAAVAAWPRWVPDAFDGQDRLTLDWDALAVDADAVQVTQDGLNAAGHGPGDRTGIDARMYGLRGWDIPSTVVLRPSAVVLRPRG